MKNFYRSDELIVQGDKQYWIRSHVLWKLMDGQPEDKSIQLTGSNVEQVVRMINGNEGHTDIYHSHTFFKKKEYFHVSANLIRCFTFYASDGPIFYIKKWSEADITIGDILSHAKPYDVIEYLKERGVAICVTHP